MTTKRAHLVAFLGALLACFGVVFWMAGPYLLALFLGGTLAMLAYPAYRWILARSGSPRLAALSVTVLMLLLVIAPLTWFSIRAVRQGISVGRELADLKEFSPKALTASLSRWQLVRALIGEPKEIDARLKGALQSAGEFTSDVVVSLGIGIPQFLLQLTLALIAFYFFLVDGERFVEWVMGLDVLDRGVQDRLEDAFRDTAISAVLAGLAAAFSQAAMIAIGFRLLSIPAAFLAGGLTFIFAWIPVLGTLPAFAAGFLYLYIEGDGRRIALLLMLALAAGVVDNLIRPMVLKGRDDMHPLLGFLAIISGIRLFGILGVFIGPILVAMLLSLLKIWPALGGAQGGAPSRRSGDEPG